MLLLQGVADEGMFFAAAQTLAQGLSQWSLLIVAGSLVIIVSPSYYRSSHPRVRATYSCSFPPGYTWRYRSRGNTSAALVRGVPGWLAPGRVSCGLLPWAGWINCSSQILSPGLAWPHLRAGDESTGYEIHPADTCRSRKCVAALVAG